MRFNFKRAFVGDTLSGGGLVGQRPEVGQAVLASAGSRYGAAAL